MYYFSSTCQLRHCLFQLEGQLSWRTDILRSGALGVCNDLEINVIVVVCGSFNGSKLKIPTVL